MTSEYGPAYLAYAGPYSSSPSSAFGHLFLVLAEAPSDPPPLWDVVTFTAVTLDAAPIRYLTVGIFGGFLGRYNRNKFHQRTREYELLDDRDLWLVELRLSTKERELLHAALGRTAGRWYPYTFFGRNCAYHLQALLAEATAAVEAPSGIVSPTGVMAAILRTPLAGRSFLRQGASGRIAALADHSPHVIERLSGESWRRALADTVWVGALPPRDRQLVQEVVQLRASEATVPFDPSVSDGIAWLRLLAAGGTPASHSVSGVGREIGAPKFHRHSRLQAGYATSASMPARLSLKWRGAMHDELDPWLVHRPLSTMELLSVELSSPVDRLAPRLESAVLVSQRALAPSTWIKRRTSWMAEIHVRRDGLLGPEKSHAELRAGLGHTAQLRYGTYVYGLGTLAGVATLERRAALAPGVEMGVVSLPTDRARLGLRWNREHDVASWGRSYQRARGWARVDLSDRVGLHWAVSRAADRLTQMLGVDWYH